MKTCIECNSFFDGVEWECPRCRCNPPLIKGFRSFSMNVSDEEVGFDSTTHAELVKLESGHFWFESRNRLIVWAIKKFIRVFRSFLEIGCGTGFVIAGIAKAFPEVKLTGSEIFCSGLTFASERVATAEFIQLDARNLPYHQHFDVIGAFDVLEHIVEDEEVLREMHGALLPNGFIVITVPQHPILWSRQDDIAHHVRRYRANELRDKVTRAGFCPVFESSFVSLLLPLMFLSRCRKQADSPDYDSSSEFCISGTLNRMLTAVMALEFFMIRAGVRFPFGGSRIMLARRD